MGGRYTYLIHRKYGLYGAEHLVALGKSLQMHVCMLQQCCKKMHTLKKSRRHSHAFSFFFHAYFLKSKMQRSVFGNFWLRHFDTVGQHQIVSSNIPFCLAKVKVYVKSDAERNPGLTENAGFSSLLK